MMKADPKELKRQLAEAHRMLVRQSNSIAELQAKTGTVARRQPASPWRPISTAKRDGSPINVWLGDAPRDDAEFYCVPGTRFSAGWHWQNGKFRPIGGLPGIPVSVQPTHWTPVPPAPRVRKVSR